MKNKILTGIALLSMALITTLNVNAFDPVDGDHDENEEGGGGGETCDLCVVENRKGETVFSCKYMKDHTCSETYLGNTLSCNNAKECS